MTSITKSSAKRRRNWPFWLAAGAIIVVGLGLTAALWFAGGRADLRRARAELRASGMPTTVDEIAPPAVPTSENAAVIYEKALQQLKSSTQRFGKAAYDIQGAAAHFDEIPPEQWPAQDKQRLSEYLGAIGPAIDQAKAAARLGKCRFPLDYKDGAMMLFPHLAGMRGLARVMRLDSLDRLSRGDIDGAVDSSLAGLGVARHTGSDRTLIGMLVAVACSKMALQAVDALLRYGDPTPPQLERLLDALEKQEPAPDLRRVLETETWAGLDTYKRLRSHRLTLSELFAMVDASPGSYVPWRWVADRDEARFVRTMLQFVSLTDKPYLEAEPGFENMVSGIDRSSERLYPVAKRLIPQWSAVLTCAATADSELQTRRLAVAAMLYKKRHGAFPARLNDLVLDLIPKMPVDPFSGRPYLYKRGAGAFVVYSVGENKKDDGGTPGRKVGKGSGDIVFSFTAKP